MPRDRSLWPLSIALLLSFALHGILIAFVPMATFFSLPEREERIEVELLPPELATPSPPVVEEQMRTTPEPVAKPEPSPEPAVKLPEPPSLEPLYGALERLSLLQNQPAPPVKVTPPSQEELPEEEFILQTPTPSFAQALLQKIEQGDLPSGNPRRKDLPLGFGQVTAEGDLPGRISTPLPSLPLPAPPVEPEPVAVQENATLGIQGPVSERRLLFQPPPPEVQLNTETEIELKFWVLPDGTVGRVVPVRRGDTRLEAIAIAYLKRWRFEPLSASSEQKEQWGTIAFKFLFR